MLTIKRSVSINFVRKSDDLVEVLGSQRQLFGTILTQRSGTKISTSFSSKAAKLSGSEMSEITFVMRGIETGLVEVLA